jgi:hypothetical protein
MRIGLCRPAHRSGMKSAIQQVLIGSVRCCKRAHDKCGSAAKRHEQRVSELDL